MEPAALSRLEALRRLGIQPYPARSRRNGLLADLSAAPSPSPMLSHTDGPPAPVPIVAGRIVALEPDALTLEDCSGRLRLTRGGSAAEAKGEAGDGLWPLLGVGDTVELELEPAGPGWAIRSLTLLAPALRPLEVEGPDGAMTAESRAAGEGASPETLLRRARLIQALRRYFVDQGFLEVETPIMALRPGLEPHLDPFESRYRSHPSLPGVPVYLLTSPEYAMKRLMVAGVEKLFQLSKVFRNGETGPFHNPEFTMIEWYRAYASYLDIMTDLEGLVLALAQALGLGSRLSWQGNTVDLTPPWPRLTVRQAFIERAGIDLAEAGDADSLRAAAKARGIDLPAGESWEEGYFRILIDHVEPGLGLGRPVFLTDYPAPFAALSKVRDEPFPVAERFELYIAGVEVGNAYSELNDATAQRARFEEERAQRRAQGLPDFTPDEDYLEALERGLPPTGGIAVGVDRLVMLMLDVPDVRRTLAFPFPMGLRPPG